MATCEATQWDDTRPNELEGSRQITACQGWFSAVHLRDGEMERGRDDERGRVGRKVNEKRKKGVIPDI